MEQVTIRLIDIENAISNGMLARGKGSACGCGRAYVCLTNKSQLKLFKQAFTNCGIRYIGPAYGSGKYCAYIGYDNGTGTPLAQSENIASNLNKIGIQCYADAVGD